MQSTGTPMMGSRHLAFYEAESLDQFFWTSVFNLMYKENMNGDQAIKITLESAEIITGLAPRTSPASLPTNSQTSSISNHVTKPMKAKPNPKTPKVPKPSNALANNSLPAVRDPATGRMTIPPNPNSKRQQRLKQNVINNKNKDQRKNKKGKGNNTLPKPDGATNPSPPVTLFSNDLQRKSENNIPQEKYF